MIARLQRMAKWLLAACMTLAVLYAIKLPPAASRPADANAPTRVALFVNGTLGDKSFFDSAARGLAALKTQFGMHTRVIEAGIDPTRWESSLIDVADGGDFDVILIGSFAMKDALQRLAPQYPRTKFIIFDAAVDYKACACGNVYSMLFRQNEGGYLAGLLAAEVTKARQLGIVGAMQIPVIDDFIVGFTAGAQSVQPGLQVRRQYVNSYNDPAAAKEIAKAMYGQGLPLLFQVASGSGQGVIEAAAEAGRMVIGVDSDQYAIFKASSPERAKWILTSVMKNVDVGIVRALTLHRQNALRYGQIESLGLREGGVSLALGSELLDAQPAAVMDGLKAAQQDIASGAISVPSAFSGGGKR